MTQPGPISPYASVPVQVAAQNSPVGPIVAWTLTVFSGGYTLPWAIAATRHKRDTTSIALVNVLLGWTFVGWIVALIKACGKDLVLIAPVQQVVVMNNVTASVGAPVAAPGGPAAGWYAAPNGGPGQQYWDGTTWTGHTQAAPSPASPPF